MSLDAMDWSLCRSFLAILREGSLSGAARRLNVTQPTIRRHLETLEGSLATSLFVRSPSGLRPTAAAQRLRSSAEAMEGAAGLFLRVASADGEAVTGTVRITASEIVGVEILPNLLAAIAARHRDLQFEVVLTNANLDLLRYEADLAVRMVRPEQGDLIARKAAKLSLGLFAHRRWLDQHAAPGDIAALIRGGRLIGYDRDQSILRGFEARGISIPRSAFCYRSDSDLAQLAAMRAGLGIGICQLALAARDPELERILPSLVFDLDAWVVVHPDRRTSPGVRMTFEALIEGITEYAASARIPSAPPLP